MELSNLQNQIVQSPHHRVVVLSRAASGKTAVLTERVRYLLHKGVNPSSICVITFTNLAAQELKARLGNDYTNGLFVGTIHGLAYKMLSQHGIKCDDLIRKEDFDAFFERLEEHPECVQKYDYLLLDEAQDSSDKEFNFIFAMIDPFSYFIVGDDFQSIYSFRGAQPRLLINLTRRADTTTYIMNENYRNAPIILDAARNIIKKNNVFDDSIAMRDDVNGIYLSLTYSAAKLVELVKKYGSYGDWSFLCRTNQQVQMIQRDLEHAGIPTLTFKQGEVTQKELQEFLESNKVKVLTIHSSKGLTLRYVGVYGTYWRSAEEVRLNYVAATRAKDGLFWFKTAPKKRNTFKSGAWF